jgi:type IV pilus assembly protein PilW
MRTQIASARRMHGLSLVELMIAMTLGLLTVAAIGWVYQGTIQTFRTHDALSRLQESARYAFELMGKDLRMVGAAGCGYDPAQAANVLNANTDWYKNLFGRPLVAEEEDGTAGAVTEFSDALRVVRADMSREYVVQNHVPGTATFTLAAAHDISSGELMLATDCLQASVFQAAGAAGTTVMHTAGGSPGNSTANLGGGGVAYTFLPANGPRLYKLSATTYYVDANVVGVPSLFRLRPVGATATLTPEELVEGVEDLQVSFGVDTTATPDGNADFVDPDGDGDPYLTAAQVDSAAVPGPAADRWSRVVSVRISLLLRTTEDRVVPQAQAYSYNGANVTAGDLRLRKVFTHVINVRNR